MVTASSREEAEKIATTLLERKLIACANILGPVSSRFWWQGKIDSAEEYMIFMKTKRELFDQVADNVKQLHSYEVPEIIALPIVEGAKPYLEWINSSLTGE
ncbi:MAG TPA: divalent-cation tolerance protein CutA [Candidatus Bathyarchaeota archaeon]|nr:divalent-cation tolerance protein CutA [Candidatus Bathyarchaeota archaeon]